MAKPTSELIDASGAVIAESVFVARTFWKRAIGLIGTAELNPGEGVWIDRCPSIHTCFMRFPIDVLFLDRQNRVLRTISALAPWRIYAGCRNAVTSIELAAGTLARTPIAQGQTLSLRPR